MKNLTLTLPDDIYRKARSKAAAADVSLSRVVQDWLKLWAVQDSSREALAARLDALFAQSDARDRKKADSAGPFGRDELYAGRLERFR